jgi:hypothetical protein
MQTKKVNLKKGQAMLTMVVFFMFASMTIVFGVINPILKQVAVSKNLVTSKESYYLANSAIEDVFYRLKNGKQVGTTEILSLNNATTTTVTTNTPTGKQIVSTADKNNNIRKIQTNLVLGTGVSFNYGIQSGQGGFILENSARVTGNVYSSGSITGSGNTIYGDAVSSGLTGLIDDIHTTGSAYAHTIQDSDVDVNAFYVTKTNTTVDGISYPNSPDQPSAPLPISDEQIADLEADALAGGVITSPCPYVITTTRTLGPVKIDCDLEISGNPTITLNGPVWVNGNISIKNTAILRVSSGLGSQSVAIIADKATNRTTSSSIELVNSSQFFGSGSTGSFIFLISQNNSAELGGSEDAISMDNSASGAVILYAGHGLISINNNATLKEVTGYKIKAKNSANIVYDTGLANTLFSGGPGGGYVIIDWMEVE